jgi:hypothetical protein
VGNTLRHCDSCAGRGPLVFDWHAFRSELTFHFLLLFSLTHSGFCDYGRAAAVLAIFLASALSRDLSALSNMRLVAKDISKDDPNDKLKERMNRVKNKLASAINKLDP